MPHLSPWHPEALLNTSRRDSLVATVVIGGASIITIALGLARTKCAALLLGPAGIGTIGLLQSLLQFASMIAAAGIASSGTRMVAATAGVDTNRLAVVRRTLFWASCTMAVLAVVLMMAFRNHLSTWVLADDAKGSWIPLLSLGVAASVVTAAQTALLTGMRRIRRFAVLNVVAGVLGTIAGIACLFAFGRNGLLPFVLATPLALAVCGFVAVRKRPGPDPEPVADPIATRDILRCWRDLLGTGFAITAANAVALGGHLAIRTIVQHDLGAAELGDFQAAWYISVTYLSIVLQAMGVDYLPRLSAVVADREAANRTINDQMEVALLIASPLILAMIGLGPVIVHLLYSSEFGGASAVLRWQLLGDVFKIASWPVSYVLLASGSGHRFFLTETLTTACLVGLVAVLVPVMGLQATGIAVAVSYALYLPLVVLVARTVVPFTANRAVRLSFGALLAAAAVAFAAAAYSPLAGMAATLLLVPWFAWRALAAVGDLLPARFRRKLAGFGLGRAVATTRGRSDPAQP